MIFQTLFATFLIVFCSASIDCCDLSYKSEFGQKFEAALRAETVNLAVIYGKLEIDFYGKILKNLPAALGDEQNRIIVGYRQDFSEFLAEIQNDELTNKEIVQKLLGVMKKQQLLNIVGTLQNANTNFDLYEFLEENGYTAYTEQRKNAGQTYFVNIREKWLQLYAAAPTEEISKHAEFQEINKLFKGDPANLPAMNNALEKAIKFFNLKYWSQLIIRKK